MNKNILLTNLPAEWPTDLLPEIQQRVQASGRKTVVLDDDPTGTQTVHGIPVLTTWSVDALAGELRSDAPAFYLLTNSRSLTLPDAQALNAEIGLNLTQAAQQAGQHFAVVSRSDSTLRGHFPGEIEALAEAINTRFDGWLIIPFFLEGGRYTINDIHYVAEGDTLTPAGETEFAKDAAFGYRASDLREWVAEKTDGRITANDVLSISIDDLRVGGPARVTEKLMTLENGAACIINAASYRDVEIFVTGLLAAEAGGKAFLYRTAASFVRVRAGITPRPLLTSDEMASGDGSGGGLIVVGSYVPRTGTQINALFEKTNVQQVELNVKALLGESQQEEIERAIQQVETNLSAGNDVALYTSRELITGADAAESLAIGKRVSDSLIAVVRGISTKPRFLLAKGGITSSDVATEGLGIKKAQVMGQILPGVPVWQAGAESRYPGMSYIVFPGNVGGPDALVDVVKMFSP